MRHRWKRRAGTATVNMFRCGSIVEVPLGRPIDEYLGSVRKDEQERIEHWAKVKKKPYMSVYVPSSDCGEELAKSVHDT